MTIQSIKNFVIDNILKRNTADSRVNIKPYAWKKTQIGSKIWLCDILEETYPHSITKSSNIWILAGWHGILAFMLLTRKTISINQIVSTDIDPDCEILSNWINDYWKDINFKAYTADCNSLSYVNDGFEEPDVIINTSTEHIKEDRWFRNIPDGKFVVIQSTDMKLEDHVNTVLDEDELCEKYKLSDIEFKGRLFFDFKSKWSFNRFMLMGFK